MISFWKVDEKRLFWFSRGFTNSRLKEIVVQSVNFFLKADFRTFISLTEKKERQKRSENSLEWIEKKKNNSF